MPNVKDDARKNPLYKLSRKITFSSGAASQALSTVTVTADLPGTPGVQGTAGLNGFSIQPVLFTTPAGKLLVKLGGAASKSAFDWLVTNESMLYVEHSNPGTIHFQLVDATGENLTPSGGADSVMLIEYE